MNSFLIQFCQFCYSPDLTLQKAHIQPAVQDLLNEDPAILRKEAEERAKAERIRKEAEDLERVRKEAEAKARERELNEVWITNVVYIHSVA